MKSAIDSAGRVVIPSDIRHAAGLAPGTSVSVELRDGVVFIEPAAGKVRIVKRRRLWVAEQIESSEPLSLDTVNAVRDQVRKR